MAQDRHRVAVNTARYHRPATVKQWLIGRFAQWLPVDDREKPPFGAGWAMMTMGNT